MPSPTPHIDRILEAIRAEARARGSKGWAGGFSGELSPAAGGGGPLGLRAPDAEHVADFLSLPLDAFIAAAYRKALGRDADAAGAAHYQRLMLRGRATRVEVLGRLCLSPEGRKRGRTVEGLLPALAFALLYRVPLIGPAAALAARALRLPAHWQDRASLEAAALATGSWMRR